MSRSQNQFNKKQKEKKRLEKKQQKQQRKEDRKANSPAGNLEDMMAYIDEDGNIVDSPPMTVAKKEIDASEIEISIPKKSEEDTLAERRGRVSFFDTSKGYGFINQDGTQERFFVHQSNLRVPIQEGDKVSFIAKKGLKGPEADDVKVIR